MKIYHGTTRRRIPKILAQGLQPRAEKLSVFHFQNESKKLKAIGLTISYIDAWAYASRKAGMFNDVPIIIELDYPKERLDSAYESKCNTTKTFVSMKKIPAKYITGFETVEKLDAQKAARILGLEVEE